MRRSVSYGGIGTYHQAVTAVFSSVLYSQTSGQECVLPRATFALVRHMRRRWQWSLSWKPSVRRLSILVQHEGTLFGSSNMRSFERVEPSTSQGDYSFAVRCVSTSVIVADRRFQTQFRWLAPSDWPRTTSITRRVLVSTSAIVANRRSKRIFA